MSNFNQQSKPLHIENTVMALGKEDLNVNNAFNTYRDMKLDGIISGSMSFIKSVLIKDFKVDNLILSKFDNYDLIHPNKMKIQAPYNIKHELIELNFFGPLKQYNVKNNNSLVFQLNTKYFSILFTGDILKEAEYDISDTFQCKLKSDIIKVAHHGSNSSSTDHFLQYVQPKYAVISYAKDNKYGFPHQEAVKNIIKYTTEIYYTAIDNTIIIYQDKVYKFCSLTMKRRRFIV